MKTPVNGPLVLPVRVVEALELSQATTGGCQNEPQWTVPMVQRVLGAVTEVVLDAVSNGEEVQLGKLGKFFPKVLSERTVSANYADDPEKLRVPRRVKLGFDPSGAADDRVTRLFSVIEEVLGEDLPSDSSPTMGGETCGTSDVNPA